MARSCATVCVVVVLGLAVGLAGAADPSRLPKLPTNPDGPRQLHLSLGLETSTMVLTWMTNKPSNASGIVWGTASGNYSASAAADVSTYNVTVGYVNVATFVGLSPGVTYYYRCGDVANKGITAFQSLSVSPEHSFVQPNRSPGQPFKAIVYGDMGVVNSDQVLERVVARAESGDIDFIVHLGDISYSGDYRDDLFAGVWDSFFERIEPIATRVPYQVAVGNNDRGCKSDSPCKGNLPYSQNFTDFKHRFTMPSTTSGGNMFYSFDWGDAHFTAISTETDYPDAPFGEQDNSAQLDFLAADWAAANEARTERNWIFAFGHRPIYTSIVLYNDYFHPIGSSCKGVQRGFESLFHNYSVDFYLNGHIHGYERNYPVYDSEVSKSYDNPPYTIHIMSGAAGDIEGQDPAIAYSLIKPRWTAFRSVDPSLLDKDDTRAEGYGVLTVFNATHTLWEFFRARDEHLIDTQWVTKKAP